MKIIDNLSAFFVAMYNKDASVLIHIFECGIPHGIMVECYREMVTESGLTPIGNLMVEEKIKLWEECKATGVNKNKIVDAAKILHTIKFINENS